MYERGWKYLYTEMGEEGELVLDMFNVNDCLCFISTMFYLNIRWYNFETVHSFIIARYNTDSDLGVQIFSHHIEVTTTLIFLSVISFLTAVIKIMFFL